ncbi:hypothetical protein RESH_05947 [Rhodopirellula europaea SH398]|uniref:Uncharacterized protein n=1 Tax=Rhodopirellula europaea SH398 TaxID=1263868 RepID=M5SBB8_9BACT|nr:hypothetical protein RESH_05947 [Rhodopirellula europaea SH398]
MELIQHPRSEFNHVVADHASVPRRLQNAQVHTRSEIPFWIKIESGVFAIKRLYFPFPRLWGAVLGRYDSRPSPRRVWHLLRSDATLHSSTWRIWTMQTIELKGFTERQW